MQEQLQDYYVGQEVTLRGLFLTGATVGSMIKNQYLLLVQDASALSLQNGDPIFVEDAGALSGDLVTTVASHAGAEITLADHALSNVDVVLVGTPTDPTTVTCDVRLPDGTNASPAPTPAQVVQGRWEAIFTPTLEGDHFYRFSGTGAAAGNAWRKFVVLPERVS